MLYSCIQQKVQAPYELSQVTYRAMVLLTHFCNSQRESFFHPLLLKAVKNMGFFWSFVSTNCSPHLVSGWWLTKIRLCMDSQYVVGFKPQKKNTQKNCAHTFCFLCGFQTVSIRIPIYSHLTCTQDVYAVTMRCC